MGSSIPLRRGERGYVFNPLSAEIGLQVHGFEQNFWL